MLLTGWPHARNFRPTRNKSSVNEAESRARAKKAILVVALRSTLVQRATIQFVQRRVFICVATHTKKQTHTHTQIESATNGALSNDCKTTTTTLLRALSTYATSARATLALSRVVKHTHTRDATAFICRCANDAVCVCARARAANRVRQRQRRRRQSHSRCCQQQPTSAVACDANARKYVV